VIKRISALEELIRECFPNAKTGSIGCPARRIARRVVAGSSRYLMRMYWNLQSSTPHNDKPGSEYVFLWPTGLLWETTIYLRVRKPWNLHRQRPNISEAEFIMIFGMVFV